MIPVPIDYETLRLMWWLILGVLLAGVAIYDGFDYGVAMLLPWVAKSDLERRITINTIGPVWEGNQVWLILAGGALFAAWPPIYAIAFFGFYVAMLIVLLALILRPVAFKYRSKIENTTWKKIWDICLFLGGFVPPFIFGVAIGNILQGIPFHFDQNLQVFYTGSFFQLLDPFALLCGILSVLMVLQHGAIYLSIKTSDFLQKRAIFGCRIANAIFIVLFLLAGFFVAYHLRGYVVSSAVITNGPSSPLHKSVLLETGAWVQNYAKYHWMLCAPIFAVFGMFLANIFVSHKTGKLAFVFSSISIVFVLATLGFSMFPFLLPSSSVPNHSLLVWDASSSQMTLFIMFFAVIVLLPIVLLYSSWVYRVLKGKVKPSDIENNRGSAY